MNRPIKNTTHLHGLYVITQAPRHICIARAALRGGARLIQLRDHGQPAEKLLEIAQELRQLTGEFDALFFVCDHVQVAQQVDADGVHLEWAKISLPDARQQWGTDRLLSTGANSIERAQAAQNAGANYLGVGPVFPTQTKKDAGDAIGFNGLGAIARAVSVPVAAIGGLNEANIAQVPTAMASVVSALADLPSEKQMEAMTRTLIEKLGTRP
ncbi:thiamine-phosphate synthase [Abditibacteriota bacterium]|nr:thiamine-phosphate synthase [Abditibacteriota bacterium]